MKKYGKIILVILAIIIILLSLYKVKIHFFDNKTNKKQNSNNIIEINNQDSNNMEKPIIIIPDDNNNNKIDPNAKDQDPNSSKPDYNKVDTNKNGNNTPNKEEIQKPNLNQNNNQKNQNNNQNSNQNNNNTNNSNNQGGQTNPNQGSTPKPPVIPPKPPKPKPKPKPDTKVDIRPGQATKETYMQDGKEVTVLWTRGITPPNLKTDFRRVTHNSYDYLVSSYIPNKGWYDVNKSDSSGGRDDLLCSGAVASNMLHWWLDQNKNYIDRYLRENADRAFLPGEKNFWKDLKNYRNSFKNQYDSTIFNMFKLYYGSYNNLWADTSADFFINGYRIHPQGYINTPNFFKRDERGGFFHEVFKDEVLTTRKFSGALDSLSRTILQELQNGNIMGIEHTVISNRVSHIITIWGAEFDEKANLIGLYISDSDDKYENNVGMKKYRIASKGGKPAITTSNEKESGSNLIYIHSLKLGQDKWQKFFE